MAKTGSRKAAGVFMLRQTLPLSVAIDQLAMIWSASEAEEWAGLITFLPL